MSVKDAVKNFSIREMDNFQYKGRLIAIDPGGNTGVATKADGKYLTYTIDKPDKVFEILTACWDAVVYEDFNTAGNISKDGIHTLKVIGGILALCWKEEFKVYRQFPQQRMAFLARANGILRNRLDKHTEHETDALAHLLRWEYSNATGEIQD